MRNTGQPSVVARQSSVVSCQSSVEGYSFPFNHSSFSVLDFHPVFSCLLLSAFCPLQSQTLTPGNEHSHLKGLAGLRAGPLRVRWRFVTSSFWLGFSGSALCFQQHRGFVFAILTSLESVLSGPTPRPHPHEYRAKCGLPCTITGVSRAAVARWQGSRSVIEHFVGIMKVA